MKPYVRAAVVRFCRAVAIALIAAQLLPASGVQATTKGTRGAPHKPPVSAPPGLRLVATPQLVDVGGYVTFSVVATSWLSPAAVTLTFVSTHHGFTGRMVWENGCRCFRISVDLARRIHPLEPAHVTAIVRYRGTTFTISTAFTIRGLARNGRGFAPGGTPYLTAWVSDPTPFQNEYEHFCAWVTTADGLGVQGFTVRFSAHYAAGTRTWVGGVSSSSGIVCSHKPIGQALPGYRVWVDVDAGTLHARTSFVPRP